MNKINKNPQYKSFANFSFCGCSENFRKEKTDCYFYEEEKDMGATVPCCSYYGGYGNCPCENCEKHFSKKDAYKIIRDYIDKKDEKLGDME